MEVQRVGLAKDLDAILGALVNQLINQVLGPGGLLGASKRSSGGSLTASGQYPSTGGRYKTFEELAAANAAAQSLPDGLYVETSASTRLGPTATNELGRPIGYSPTAFCVAFKNNLYSADKSTTGGTLTNATLIVVK